MILQTGGAATSVPADSPQSGLQYGIDSLQDREPPASKIYTPRRRSPQCRLASRAIPDGLQLGIVYAATDAYTGDALTEVSLKKNREEKEDKNWKNTPMSALVVGMVGLYACAPNAGSTPSQDRSASESMSLAGQETESAAKHAYEGAAKPANTPGFTFPIARLKSRGCT